VLVVSGSVDRTGVARGHCGGCDRLGTEVADVQRAARHGAEGRERGAGDDRCRAPNLARTSPVQPGARARSRETPRAAVGSGTAGARAAGRRAAGGRHGRHLVVSMTTVRTQIRSILATRWGRSSNRGRGPVPPVARPGGPTRQRTAFRMAGRAHRDSGRGTAHRGRDGRLLSCVHGAGTLTSTGSSVAPRWRCRSSRLGKCPESELFTGGARCSSTLPTK
jgi:hypothetical protein